jgi:hypothetical protein
LPLDSAPRFLRRRKVQGESSERPMTSPILGPVAVPASARRGGGGRDGGEDCSF